jgi:DNA-binding transcriptional LysR family regulator
MGAARAFERELQQREDSGDLRVGASLTIGNYLAVRYLADYLQQFPQARVDLQVASTPEVVARVLNFELDIGLIEADVHHEDLCLTPWRDDQMRVFCRPDHALVGKARLTDRDLLGARWILREPGAGARQTFDRAMQGLLPELNIMLELRHNEAIKSAVKSGLGIGCLSEIALSEELAAGTLVALPLSGRSMHRNFYFVTRREQPDAAAIRNWMACCQGS